MAQMIDFFMKPFFIFSVSVMILGLLRLFIKTIIEIRRVIKTAGDKDFKYTKIFMATLSWIIPGKNTVNTAVVYSIVSFVFHIGLILVPVFLMEHIIIWKGAFGFGWPALGKQAADVLTVITILSGIILLGYRLFSKQRRKLSSVHDYLFLILILVIFISGYFLPKTYSPFNVQVNMLIHIVCGNLILIILPFTRLAHCILYPLLRLASAVAWHFPPNAGKELNKLLYGEENKKI
ncbi:MAG: hypothetical protein JW864_08075 [Spirochaetes bacterium]|nr:hypothetical protein [Spirochaetota bacterium]